MTLLSRENRINLGSSDRQRTSDGSELLIVDEGWMGTVTDVNAVLVVADEVLYQIRISLGMRR